MMANHINQELNKDTDVPLTATEILKRQQEFNTKQDKLRIKLKQKLEEPLRTFVRERIRKMLGENDV